MRRARAATKRPGVNHSGTIIADPEEDVKRASEEESRLGNAEPPYMLLSAGRGVFNRVNTRFAVGRQAESNWFVLTAGDNLRVVDRRHERHSSDDVADQRG